MRTLVFALAALSAVIFSEAALYASDPAPPALTSLIRSNSQTIAVWTPYPAAQFYNVLTSETVGGPYSNAPGIFLGNSWRGVSTLSNQFFRLAVTPLSSNEVLTANILNRIAYGPTPDELERLAAIGPQAYINEQLAPEGIDEKLDAYTVEYTNPADPFPNTNWSFVNVTGTFSSRELYMYLTTAGSLYLDDVGIHAVVTTIVTNWNRLTNGTVVTTNVVLTTNVFYSENLLTNANFESTPVPITGHPPNWLVGNNHLGSSVSSDFVCSGAQSLRMVASTGGTTRASSISQIFAQPYTNYSRPSPDFYVPGTNVNVRCNLRFAYLAHSNSSSITLRLSGSGAIASGSDAPVAPGWIYATATGIASGTPVLYIYSSGAGEFFIDDIKLVRGTVAGVGTNHLRNGDFEAPLSPTDWAFTADFTNTVISSEFSHTGNGSLKVVATGSGGGSGDAVTQSTIPGLQNGQTYTVSFWYLPSTRNRTITVRLSGSGLVASPDTSVGALRRRLDTIMRPNYITGSPTINTYGSATLADMRAWFLMNAVGSKRQLLEVLTQFLENHFVTQASKSRDYLDIYYDDGTLIDSLATNWEYQEVSKWREALLRPDCTFYDLLKISAESPAMIIYLDTVNSRGDGTRIANENYARELYELFCMGVDNGYDQNDIVAMSRAWTGWSVEIVEPEQANNPFAPRATTYGFYPGVSSESVSNIVGVWAFNFKQANHGTNRYPHLSIWGTNGSGNMVALGPKTVPARYGPPWAGAPYQLNIPARTGTNGIQDGYDVIRHLANLPMTMEYISVKLCRLFIHDDFPNPTTRPELPEYAFYDYTNPNMSAEARLVRDCMLAWQNSTPKGNMRAVLTTIFNSDLFRSHGGSLQKVKTPLEYTASAVRALRSVNPDGTATANTDGYSLTTALGRMGSMSLFNRDNPDGYPEDGPAWISAGTLAERLRFIQSLCTHPSMPNPPARPNDAGASTVNPVALLQKKLAVGNLTNAGVVADYFLSILYPAEGKANLSAYRTAAMNFLNTADDGSASPFSNLAVSSAANSPYDNRVRGMVSFLMTLQRFHEQ